MDRDWVDAESPDAGDMVDLNLAGGKPALVPDLSPMRVGVSQY